MGTARSGTNLPSRTYRSMVSQMLRHTRTLGIVQVDEAVWKRLSKEEKVGIEKVCEEKLETYYQRLDLEPP